MNQLQQIQFDMLCELTRVCNELDLRYFLVCGSALGAVKYKGFIPWDDDIDVGMPRRDYEIFIEAAMTMLPANLFLQNFHTEVNFPQIFSKIRNISTTFIEASVSRLDICHGVYIDVFPLDEYPAAKTQQLRIEIRKRLLMGKLSTAFCSPKSGRAAVWGVLGKMCHYEHRLSEISSELERSLLSWKGLPSNLICNHGNWQGKLEYAPYEQYGKGAWATFEGLRVRVPEKYDEYLTQKYGDWRTELPKEQQTGHHFAQVVDLCHPYTDYIEKLSDGRIRVRKSDGLN